MQTERTTTSYFPVSDLAGTLHSGAPRALSDFVVLWGFGLGLGGETG